MKRIYVQIWRYFFAGLIMVGLYLSVLGATRWSSSSVTWFMSDQISTDWGTAITHASNRWNGTGAAVAISNTGITGRYDNTQDEYNVVVARFILPGEYQGGHTQLAFTRVVTGTDNFLYDCDIIIDSENPNINTSGETGIDLQSVVLHEFGHVLGLDHISDPSAVMYLYHTGVKRFLTDLDKNALKNLYGEEGAPTPGGKGCL